MTRILALLLVWFSVAGAATYVETPSLAAAVAANKLPPVAQRLPTNPKVETFSDPSTTAGQHGGALNVLMASAKDVRQMVVYGYARLIGYNHKLELEADILEHYTVQEGRIFTFHLRKDHLWSDGKPFTADGTWHQHAG